MTTDAVPVLDTAKFEHMQRIASILAEWPLLPRVFRLDESGTELSDKAVFANCFMITNQAVRWRMDPFAVALSAGVKDGRLIWEGKLVHAVIETMTGVRLAYAQIDGAGQSLGVVVSGQFSNEAAPRAIQGTVKDWIVATSAWADAANWPRQLRYRGAREWARAYAPHVMLGVITDDESLNRPLVPPSQPIAGTVRTVPDEARPMPRRGAPEIPDEDEIVVDASLSQDAEAPPKGGEPEAERRPDQVLADLGEDLSNASTTDARAEVAENYEDRIDALPPAFKRAARKMLKEAE